MENEEDDDDVTSGYPAPCMIPLCHFGSHFICVSAFRASGGRFVKCLRGRLRGQCLWLQVFSLRSMIENLVIWQDAFQHCLDLCDEQWRRLMRVAEIIVDRFTALACFVGRQVRKSHVPKLRSIILDKII